MAWTRLPLAVPGPAAKPLNNRLLLLVEVHNRRHGQLRTLAERLGVTVQAISGYVTRLKREGLLEEVEGVWRPTKKGTDELHLHISELRRFLDENSAHLRIIQETLALAANRIRTGDPVGLVMRGGHLHAARSVAAASRGRAKTAAAPGQLVVVGDLRGIVDLRPAKLLFLAHPDLPSEAGLRRARRELGRARRGADRLVVAVHGLASVAWVRRLNVRTDLEFAPLAAALDAARRGVPVAYFVPRSDLAACLATAQESQRSAWEQVPVRSVDV